MHPLGRNRVELGEMYVSMGLRMFGISLIGIFIPIYLYNLGYSAPLIFGYFFMEQVFKFLMVITTCRLIGKWGAKHVMVCGYLFMVLDFSLLLTFQHIHWPLSLIALFSALATNFFWIAYHINFAAITTEKKRGTQIGTASIVIQTVSALAPFIGGAIATYYDIRYSFALALILILCACIPLLRTKETFVKIEIKPENIRPKHIWRDLVSYANFGIDQVASEFVWPLFIFLYLGTYAKVGFVFTISALISPIMIIVVARLTDRGGQRKVIRITAIAEALSHVTRLFVRGFRSIVFVDMTNGVVRDSMRIAYHSLFYAHAEKEGHLEYLMLMEMAIDTFRALFWGILVVLALTFPIATAIRICFAIAAVSSLFIARLRTPEPA